MAPRSAVLLATRNVLYVSIAGDLIVAAIKVGAAAYTGGSAMWSEAVHSLVDSSNSILLLYGVHRAKRTPDQEHPFGYGREIYFWSFVVAVQVFALGAGVALVEGVTHVLHPTPIAFAEVNYIVLGLSALFDGATWLIALRGFRRGAGDSDLFQAMRASKDPPSFMVVFEDSAALIGLVIALVGSYLSIRLDLPILDGVASILISLVLALTAVFLARETKGLLIGESADPAIVMSLLRIAREMEGVAHANGILTVHLAPRQIAVALSLEFSDELQTPALEIKVSELEQRLRALHPEVIAVFVKPQTALGYAEAVERRRGKTRQIVFHTPSPPGPA
ncbi:cation transporter [Rhodoblastus sphagnicola]|uniref:Cation transporter n=1 Tax=Rhodoblastus sphagnicola TaxID=333368 RepID=A0A2S6N1V4_9HYPH|nr:cation diffusion facilitator family transporter [Rhodoblastus sphagnicola]MBB4198254.1 cation diffusion facilitator family transporter [Rhodoblastus sphagnicola]PPQ28605.1 cation transporter [Rhodoblastus sphagnicola]